MSTRRRNADRSPSPAAVTRWGARLRAAWRPEDLLLAGWVLLQPALLRALGAGPASGADPFGGSDPLVGLAYLVATVGAVACLVTRPRGDAAGAVRDPNDWILVGPLGGGLILTGGVAAANLLGDAAPGMALAGAAVLVGGLLPGVLPPLSVAARRLLVVPFVLLTASFFNAVVAAVADLFDVRSLFAGGLWTGLQALPILLGLAVLFTGVYYLMLVVAPRQLAVRDGDVPTWLTRYGLFLAAELLAVSLFGAAG